MYFKKRQLVIFDLILKILIQNNYQMEHLDKICATIGFDDFDNIKPLK